MKEKSARSISVFTLTMINIAAICSIRNFPLTAEYGFATVFFFAFAALVFFIPVSFVSAELSSAWPERGVYRWVTEAMGPKAGFLAIWLQWAENIIYYPIILSFIGATFAYIFNPALATNKFYIFSVILFTMWLLTFINFRGMKTSSWISSFCASFGTILPGILIIILGAIWVGKGDNVQISFGIDNLFPDLSSIRQLAILSAVLLSFAGMEMSAVHAKETKDPKKTFPRAIIFSALIIFVLYTFGSLAISVVVPKGEIQLASGAIEAFRQFLDAFNLGWAVPVIATVMTIGGLGTVSTWIVGPTKGVLASALDGDLPPLFQKVNKQNMPVSLLIFQASVVSVLSCVFLFMPNINSSFLILVDLSVLLYLIMYVMMFISAIILRYTQPEVKRGYKIPFKNIGIWTVGIIGSLGATFTFVLGFFPAAQLDAENLKFYDLFIATGIILFCAVPFVVYAFKRPTWKKNKSNP